MMQLYHADGTRSLRVRWLLEELGVPYQLHRLAFPPRIRDPDYLAVNPLGSLPFLVNGDTRPSESMAICEWLLARHCPTSITVGPDEPEYADHASSAGSERRPQCRRWGRWSETKNDGGS